MKTLDEIINDVTEQGKLPLTIELVKRIVEISAIDSLSDIDNKFITYDGRGIVKKITSYKNMMRARLKNKRVHLFPLYDGSFHVEIINLNKSKHHIPSVHFMSLGKNATVNSIRL